MIVADTSALIAIALGEPETNSFLDAIAQADRVLISAASVVEARMVIHGRRGERGVLKLDDIIRAPVFEIVPLSVDDLPVIHAAFVSYGKGNGHPAGLNFGDLFSYALAKTRGLPLLFKGDDFGHTDIEAAVSAGA